MKGIQLELGFEDKRSLFETILDIYNLKTAFKRVKANKGAPGIDGITIEEYEQNLEEELNQLKEEVQNWSYNPHSAGRMRL